MTKNFMMIILTDKYHNQIHLEDTNPDVLERWYLDYIGRGKPAISMGIYHKENGHVLGYNGSKKIVK